MVITQEQTDSGDKAHVHTFYIGLGHHAMHHIVWLKL